MPKKPLQKYGLTSADRNAEIERRFGIEAMVPINALLATINAPTEEILGAIVFCARGPQDIPELLCLANEDPNRLLNIATVKQERGG